MKEEGGKNKAGEKKMDKKGKWMESGGERRGKEERREGGEALRREERKGKNVFVKFALMSVVLPVHHPLTV